jgi:hypothetical protein
MSQDRTSRAGSRQLPCWGRLLLLGVGLACLGGCTSGPGATGYDPLRGGPPLPAAPPTSTARGGAESDLGPALADSGVSSPAALAMGTSARPNDSAGGPGVKVLPPRPSAAAPTPITTAGGTSAPTTDPTYEQLQQQLQARGVVWQQLRTGVEGGEWLFVCAIPDPATPGVQRHYEGRAVGPNGLAAIRAVLHDIENDAKQRGER